MTPPEISLESPVKEKIAWAERLYAERGGRLRMDPVVADLLERFRNAAEASHREMGRSGIAEACMRCARYEGGSCCGKGLEDRYSGLLLLVNLLLDRPLPRERLDPRGCFFLGEDGCLLLARHVICVNYLCTRITQPMEPARIRPLRDREGEELDLLFLLTEKVKALLRGME